MIFPNARIEKYYQQCNELLSFSGLSWWIIDLEEDPDTFYCNRTMCDTFDLDNGLLGHSVSKTCPIAGDFNKFIAIKNTTRAQKVFSDFKALKDNTLSEYQNRFPYYDEAKDKILYFTSCAKALDRNEEGKATLLFGIIEPETVSEILYRQALYDSLTGLRNRREFDNQLQFLINLAKRERKVISLIFCDIDHFKQYNDELGHYAGDECLKKIARSLEKTCCRETDIVCRYGGEEFAVIIYGEDKSVSALAESIRIGVSDLAIPHPSPNVDIVTVSAGFTSLVPNDSTSSRILIEKADCGLYQAKTNGRNQTIDCTCTEAEIISNSAEMS
ncbi:diguanylate cyclase [Vibrio sp. SCSIO 43136]|uniref:GGDEF domain-containing protein n=1 Tax=Vibrio sp. SCSIO 43136 TaxID=2819101 RepID=UPI0020762121|nr:diguanylate cyclase [Vibrio sp. SCSIO 43136]USD67376.1 GGDEF domain-containing protein [Vibrio sp. SCSIO 43136]